MSTLDDGFAVTLEVTDVIDEFESGARVVRYEDGSTGFENADGMTTARWVNESVGPRNAYVTEGWAPIFGSGGRRRTHGLLDDDDR
jgi:hypothetical protein